MSSSSPPPPVSPSSSPPANVESTPDVTLSPRWVWIAFILVAVTVPFAGLAYESAGRLAPSSPALALPLPAFELQDEHSRPFNRERMLGQVWVADFIFTSCPTVCPKLTARMADIQKQTADLGDSVHLVSFTVDPENDTPAVLADYAAKHGATERWSYVTGPLEAVEQTVMKGFHIAMGKQDSGNGLMEIFHGEKLVLVNKQGTIVGFYDANDEGIAKLLVHVRRLAR